MFSEIIVMCDFLERGYATSATNEAQRQPTTCRNQGDERGDFFPALNRLYELSLPADAYPLSLIKAQTI